MRDNNLDENLLKRVKLMSASDAERVYEAIEKFIKERGDELQGPAEILIMIGPEGDFSREEVKQAVETGFKIIHLGESRLRTETAAVAAVSSIYFYPFNK
jgi:RsmE family RNA methyltransferase